MFAYLAPSLCWWDTWETPCPLIHALLISRVASDPRIQPGELYPMLFAWAPTLHSTLPILPNDSLWQPLGIGNERMYNKLPERWKPLRGIQEAFSFLMKASCLFCWSEERRDKDGEEKKDQEETGMILTTVTEWYEERYHDYQDNGSQLFLKRHQWGMQSLSNQFKIVCTSIFTEKWYQIKGVGARAGKRSMIGERQ